MDELYELYVETYGKVMLGGRDSQIRFDAPTVPSVKEKIVISLAIYHAKQEVSLFSKKLFKEVMDDLSGN